MTYLKYRFECTFDLLLYLFVLGPLIVIKKDGRYRAPFHLFNIDENVFFALRYI